MRWYLLRDRRHEGPYTKEQIVEGVKAGKMDPRDYLLPEQAFKDQSSFAYISAGDICGPEVLYDLKKAEAPAASFQVRNPQQTVFQSEAPSSPSSKEAIRSEFEDGLESTQLIRLKNIKVNSSVSGISNVPTSFVSQSENTFQFPWKIAGLVAVVLALVGFFATPLASKLSSSSTASVVKTDSEEPARTVTRSSTNRVPTGRVQLPTTGQRPEEPSAIASPRSEERETPIKRRKRRSRSRSDRGTEPREDDTDAASDAENVDEGDNVDEDNPSDEDANNDEADI